MYINIMCVQYTYIKLKTGRGVFGEMPLVKTSFR